MKDPIHYMVGQATFYENGCGFGRGWAGVGEPKNEVACPQTVGRGTDLKNHNPHHKTVSENKMQQQ